MTPAEAGRKSAEARRRRAAQAAEASSQDAVQAARTFRQRLGVALSQLDQDTLNAVVSRLAKAGNAHALSRLADQAFGRPSEQDEGPAPSQLGTLSRDELAATLAGIDALPSVDPRPPVHAGVTKDAAPTPARLEPHGGDFLREPLTEAEEPLTSPSHPEGGRMHEETTQEPEEAQESEQEGSEQAEASEEEAAPAEGEEGEAGAEGESVPEDV